MQLVPQPNINTRLQNYTDRYVTDCIGKMDLVEVRDTCVISSTFSGLFLFDVSLVLI